ncbi:MCE family protein [Actinosynnema pretiosum subsp. pretiosum]|uniref:Virulence factor Mce family protein n=2 Tax=Actinosynnema TaxID=40566 RepID=C6WH36_ACTMD|nr:MCE family protein [Actinosynnema mirum]ACU36104.1 virulence factor Mce family protein [Actinosynnema mirum DSM 43827]AXX29557.1 MCE-family protein Mce1C [Actinosynnema pretiosum subsp. pretiosum]QUF06210.1 MCE family protein [Actinosynnema pretiosum subsp. pretiosum]
MTRRPALIGAFGLVALVVAVALALGLDAVPLTSGTRYRAEFAEAAGLEPDDEVRVSGMKVGEVTRVELRGDRVLVEFRVRGPAVGDRSTADIRIKTLLGQKFLALDSAGGDPLDPDTPIPLERTTSPYDVVDAFNGLAGTLGGLDAEQLAESFRVLSDSFRDTPEHVRGALDGLTSLSRTISTRDQELRTLLDGTEEVSGALAERADDVTAIVEDGNRLLAEINRRRAAISGLLDGARELSRQLSGLVADNDERLRPALEQVERVTDLLRREQAAFERGLSLAGPYYRLLSDATGTGPWVDTYVCGLVVTTERRDCPTGGR